MDRNRPEASSSNLLRARGRRPIDCVLGGAIVVLVVIALALFGRAGRGPSGVPHWDAVALGKRYLEAGKPRLALQAIGRIEDHGPGAGEAMAVAGMALASLDRRAESRRALESALVLQPNQPMAHKVLAAIELSLGNYEGGLSHLRSAAELDPRDARPWIAMGKAYHDLGRYQESADSYQAAYHRDPVGREARLGLIAAALKIRRPDRATSHLLEMLRESPGDTQLLGLAARHALALGHLEQAAGFAGRSLATDPDNVDALVARATFRSLRGQPAGAREDLERAVAIAPISVEALRLLAQVETRLGRDDRARSTSARARAISDCFEVFDRLSGEIARRPDDPEPRWRMGQVAARADLTEIAANSFRAALAIDPRCPQARAGLAALGERMASPVPPQ